MAVRKIKSADFVRFISENSLEFIRVHTDRMGRFLEQKDEYLKEFPDKHSFTLVAKERARDRLRIWEDEETAVLDAYVTAMKHRRLGLDIAMVGMFFSSYVKDQVCRSGRLLTQAELHQVCTQYANACMTVYRETLK